MPELGKQILINGESGGRFVFADLDELDSIIADLETLRVDIAADDEDFVDAIGTANPPARDDMSQLQADAYRESLRRARRHNASMLAYVVGQLEKLRAARNAYANADAYAEDRLLDAERAGR
jgi:hypothetical protein